MGVTKDDKIEAVNIGVTLSSQLIAASLSMLTIIAALFVFIIDKREVSYFFYILIVLSFLSFISSIFLGGQGIDDARKNGFIGTWILTCSESKFNYQAILCLLGIIFFISSIFFTSPKIDASLEYLKKIDTIILQRSRYETILENENDSLKLEIKQINQKMEELCKTTRR